MIRRESKRSRMSALCLCALQATTGCYSHLRGPVPRAPNANAPRQERISYYNRYHPIQYLDVRRGQDPSYGLSPIVDLEVGVLADGREVQSLHELEPAVGQATRLSRCAQVVDSVSTTRTILSSIMAAFLVGGATAGVYAASNNLVVVGAIGGTTGFVGLVGLPVVLIFTGVSARQNSRAGFQMYDPLLRERLALPLIPVDGPEPKVPGASCQ